MAVAVRGGKRGGRGASAGAWCVVLPMVLPAVAQSLLPLERESPFSSVPVMVPVSMPVSGYSISHKWTSVRYSLSRSSVRYVDADAT